MGVGQTKGQKMWQKDRERSRSNASREKLRKEKLPDGVKRGGKEGRKTKEREIVKTSRGKAENSKRKGHEGTEDVAKRQRKKQKQRQQRKTKKGETTRRSQEG